MTGISVVLILLTGLFIVGIAAVIWLLLIHIVLFRFGLFLL